MRSRPYEIEPEFAPSCTGAATGLGFRLCTRRRGRRTVVGQDVGAGKLVVTVPLQVSETSRSTS
ncbi:MULTISPECIES: hypothetical protein [unclassified Streptomyces]|uniref:hypothetical protein n=1 Tax=unclassified Streptomyces TaxID=2593676 RepID=UPI002DDC0E7F|nr:MULTISPECIES: hypothetical protein [unclassified Streptomyces]WSC43330.1 hypothetical protein OIE61_04810 [Streptomyces sp. NBC_01762]WSD22867.1 hypothetical protein OHA26_04865 [Streptomyces sp. NBC_01751]WSF88861.1 hypothetical protein OIE70_40640 [Streptomyces sp. NBC_01744]